MKLKYSHVSFMKNFPKIKVICYLIKTMYYQLPPLYIPISNLIDIMEVITLRKISEGPWSQKYAANVKLQQFKI